MTRKLYSHEFNDLGNKSEQFIRDRHALHIDENTGDESRLPPEGPDRPDLDHDYHKSPSALAVRDTKKRVRGRDLTDKTTSKTKRNDSVKKR